MTRITVSQVAKIHVAVLPDGYSRYKDALPAEKPNSEMNNGEDKKLQHFILQKKCHKP